MQGLGIQTMCVSPLSRASETATLAMGDLDWIRHEIDELKEVTIGVHDGQMFGPWYQEWKAGKRELEGAETRVEFRDRCVRGINKALKMIGPVLICCAGFGRMIRTYRCSTSARKNQTGNRRGKSRLCF